MMTNLLAILVSLAMMFTGAGAPVTQPVSRTILISDLTVQHNDEEVVLSPFATLGVMTDGAKALFDFSVSKEDQVYLPFQAVADESGIIVTNDNANVTLKIDADQLETLLGSSVSVDENGAAVFGLMGDYIAAYGDILRLMNDAEATQAIMAKGEAIFNEMIDRGEGRPGSIEYDDEIYDVTTYEYDLDAKQLGALVDAIYASDEKLANFSRAYFQLLQAMPEDSGLRGFNSFEQILEKYGNMSVHITESVADSGLNIKDSILHVAIPGLQEPVELVAHSVTDGDTRVSEVNSAFEINGVALGLYADGGQSGSDLQLNLSLSINPAEAAQAQEADEEAEETEAYAETAEAVEQTRAGDGDDVLEVPDGEGDAQDAFYFTMDFDRGIDEESGSLVQSATFSFDAAEQDIHFDLTIDGTQAEDGEGEYQVSGGVDVREDSFGFGFNISVSDEEIDVRANAANAVSPDAFDPSVLAASVSADALNLYADESVQKLIAMGKSAIEAAQQSPADADAEEDAEEDVEDIEDVAPVEVDPDELELEMGEMTFGNPQFNWLPEGYRVDNVNVDEEYQDVNLNLVNDETGDTVFIDITNSYMGTNINHYSIADDGSYAPIDGTILNEEVGDGYALYSMDDGTLAYSIFPSTNALSTEDIIHILAELTF